MLSILLQIRKLFTKKLRVKDKYKRNLANQRVTDGSKSYQIGETESYQRIAPEDHFHQPSDSQSSLKDLIAIAQKEILLEKLDEDTYLEFDKDSCYNSGTDSEDDIYEDMALNNNDLYMTMVFESPTNNV